MTKTETKDPLVAYDAAVQRLNELKLEAGQLERRADELRGRIRAERDRTDRTTEAAQAMLDGDVLEGAQDASAELEETQTRRKVVARAIELQRKRVEAAKRSRDEAMIDEHEPDIREKAQKLAEALVAVGEAADELHEATTALDSEGVTRTHRLPRLRLDPIRSTVEASRANALLDELAEGYGTTVDRPVLNAARELRHKEHEAEQERRRKAGGVISAGPEGVREYLPGGKVKKPPESGGRKAGADDFKVAASWGLA